jgi:hypothetical protein
MTDITTALDEAIEGQQKGVPEFSSVNALIERPAPPEEPHPDDDPDFTQKDLEQMWGELDRDEYERLVETYKANPEIIPTIRSREDAERAMAILRTADRAREADHLSAALSQADEEAVLEDAIRALDSPDPEEFEETVTGLLELAPDRAADFAEAWDEREPGAGSRWLRAIHQEKQQEDEFSTLIRETAEKVNLEKARQTIGKLVEDHLKHHPDEARLVPTMYAYLQALPAPDVPRTVEESIHVLKTLRAAALERERGTRAWEQDWDRDVAFAEEATSFGGIHKLIASNGMPSFAEQEVARVAEEASARPVEEYLNPNVLRPRPTREELDAPLTQPIDDYIAAQETDPLREELRRNAERAEKRARRETRRR